MQLRIYYDSHCPLCTAEIEQLRRLDRNNRIQFADLHAPDFSRQFPHISREAAMAILHGETADGELLLGLDVTCRAWRAVGKHSWLGVLRWPVIRLLADSAYRLFARYRHPISGWLSQKGFISGCDEKRCGPALTNKQTKAQGHDH